MELLSQVALCQKLHDIQQEYNDLISKMRSFDNQITDAVTSCSNVKCTRPTSFERRSVAEVELSYADYTCDSMERYVKIENAVPDPNVSAIAMATNVSLRHRCDSMERYAQIEKTVRDPNVSVIPMATNMSLRHRCSEGELTLNPLQSTMSYPQNSTKMEMELCDFATDMPRSRKLLDSRGDTDSDVDVDISYDVTNPQVQRVRHAMPQVAVQSPVMISAINMDLSESYIDADSSMIAQRTSAINLESILRNENTNINVVRRSSTQRSRRRSVPVHRATRNRDQCHQHTHRSWDSPGAPDNTTSTEIDLDASLNSDATNFMDQRLAPPGVTNLVRKDSRRRSIVKKLRHIGKHLRGKNGAMMKTLAIV